MMRAAAQVFNPFSFFDVPVLPLLNSEFVQPSLLSEGKFVRAETRHQLKQDAFSRVTIGAAEKTADWTVEHRSTLIIAAIITVVLIGGVIGGWYYLNMQDEKASLELSVAV